MGQLIALFIFLVGLVGMAVIIFRKIPILVELPAQEVEGPGVLSKLKEKIKNSERIRTFSKEELLERVVSKAKDLTVKTENKLRQKSLEKKTKFSEDFWGKVRKGK